MDFGLAQLAVLFLLGLVWFKGVDASFVATYFFVGNWIEIWQTEFIYEMKEGKYCSRAPLTLVNLLTCMKSFKVESFLF